jgi:hypothetical protein
MLLPLLLLLLNRFSGLGLSGRSFGGLGLSGLGLGGLGLGGSDLGGLIPCLGVQFSPSGTVSSGSLRRALGLGCLGLGGGCAARASLSLPRNVCAC